MLDKTLSVIGITLGATVLLPQIYKTFTIRDVGSLSIWAYILSFITTTTFLIRSTKRRDLGLVVYYSMLTVFNIVMVSMIVVFGG